MAIRNIRIKGDVILRKKCKIVEEIDGRTKTLIHDMFDTMYDADGVGLAAPQVGILKKVAVVDIGDGPIVLINPEIIETEGSFIDNEGCLSIPEETGDVERPYKVKVRAMDMNGVVRELEGEGLLARAFCHEIDHLNGILFTDKLVERQE